MNKNLFDNLERMKMLKVLWRHIGKDMPQMYRAITQMYRVRELQV